MGGHGNQERRGVPFVGNGEVGFGTRGCIYLWP